MKGKHQTCRHAPPRLLTAPPFPGDTTTESLHPRTHLPRRHWQCPFPLPPPAAASLGRAVPCGEHPRPPPALLRPLSSAPHRPPAEVTQCRRCVTPRGGTRRTAASLSGGVSSSPVAARRRPRPAAATERKKLGAAISARCLSAPAACGRGEPAARRCRPSRAVPGRAEERTPGYARRGRQGEGTWPPPRSAGPYWGGEEGPPRGVRTRDRGRVGLPLEIVAIQQFHDFTPEQQRARHCCRSLFTAQRVCFGRLCNEARSYRRCLQPRLTLSQ